MVMESHFYCSSLKSWWRGQDAWQRDLESDKWCMSWSVKSECVRLQPRFGEGGNLSNISSMKENRGRRVLPKGMWWLWALGTHGKHWEQANVDWAKNTLHSLSSTGKINSVTKLQLPESFHLQMILVTWRKDWLQRSWNYEMFSEI